MEQPTLYTSLSQNLLKNLPGMLYHSKHDAERSLTFVSDGCYGLTGYYAVELLDSPARSFMDLIHPDDRASVLTKLESVLEDNLEFNCEYRIAGRDGKVKWVQEVASGVYNDSGELLYIEGYLSDITQKTEYTKLNVEETVSNTFDLGEQRLKALLNGIPDALLRIDKAGECFYYKQEKQGVHTPVNDLKTSGLVDMFPAPVAEQFLSLTHKAIDNDELVTYEYQVTGSQSETRHFEARFVKSGTREVVCIIRDVTAPVKAKAEIEIAKEFYENIINNVNIDIAVFDENNRYRLLSKSAVKDEQLREWLIGKDDFDYCKARNKSIEIAESRTEMYHLVDELKKPIEWIEELTDESGKKRFFVRTLKPLKGPDNERYKVGYGVDITALKVVQNELLRREHLLSFSHKLAKVGYWVWYPTNRKHEWSDGVFDILEEEKKNVSPSLKSYLTFIHPEDREHFRQTIELSKQSNTSYSIEYRIVTKGGKIKHIKEQSSSKRSDSNANQYLFGMVQDITEMKISQDALARSEEHFRAIAESSPIYIIELCPEYNIIYVNNLGNRGSNEVIGTPVFSFILPEYHELLKETMEKVFAQALVQNIQLQGVENGNQVEWYDVSMGPVKNDAGKVTSIILLAQNITDKKQNEHERERLIKEINNRYNELMQFSYIVSHNLRSPIANILGMSYILNPNTPPEDVKQIFDYIMQSAESIDTLIKDLNEVLTARSPLNEKREQFLISDIVGGVCNNLQQQIQQSKAFVCVDINPNADSIMSIKSYVQSIIHNLISNAIKYKSSERIPQISIKVWRVAESIHIEVADNGMGIDMEQYGAQIFGLYKRFTNQSEGKGLGLHMTKAQVESLGGSISVESELNRGTVFKIAFTS